MSRCVFFVLTISLLLALPFTAQAQEGLPAAGSASVAPASDNLSAGRSFGLGIQAEFPWGGLISLRYWATDRLGLEGVFFVLSDAGETSGVATARALYRAVDAAAVDFYVAGGASVALSGAGSDPAMGTLVGGIEINFSRPFAWNVEFGLSATIYGRVWTTFGTGVHFYF
jgi:hypothetical protein